MIKSDKSVKDERTVFISYTVAERIIRDHISKKLSYFTFSAQIFQSKDPLIDEVRTWLAENDIKLQHIHEVPGTISIMTTDGRPRTAKYLTGEYTLTFATERDALMFKLHWL